MNTSFIYKKLIATFLIIFIISSLIALHLKTQIDIAEQDEVTFMYKYGNATDFTLPNINGDNYTFNSDNGMIRLVNFMYTKCPGNNGCALTTLLMRNIMQTLEEKGIIDQVRLISIDFDYINDTMEDLAEYASYYTNDTQQWQFLFGNKTQIDQVANDWYFYFKPNSNLGLNHGDEVNPDPYAHQIVVYLVDKNGIIRSHLLGNVWRTDETIRKIEFLLDEE